MPNTGSTGHNYAYFYPLKMSGNTTTAASASSYEVHADLEAMPAEEAER
jgi:hypothetical protein